MKIAKPMLIERQMIAAILSMVDDGSKILKQKLTVLTDQKKA